MKSLLFILLSIMTVGCKMPDMSKTPSLAILNRNDTLIKVSNLKIDDIPFIKIQMNPETADILLTDSVIPSIADSTIALCVEAAFTGELLNEFKSSNIAGDYVIAGILHKGYKCKANTGFLYADKTVFTISSSEHCAEWIEKAQKNHGSVFQQILIIHKGKNVYKGTPIKTATSNIYRSACIMRDGNFAVIQSQKAMPLSDFIESLIKLEVSDALYLDMGRGWNYGWYRESDDSAPVELFDYRSPFQTNWLIIKAKN